MNLQSERKFIRYALIISIISGTSWLVWSFSDSNSTQSYDVLNTEIVFSGFGEIKLYNPQKVNLFSTNIYQDKTLGFQISKPDNSWEIHSVLDHDLYDKLILLEPKGFVDGVFVEQNHDMRFMINIFDIQKENFSLHEYVDNQIELMKSETITNSFEQVSSKDDWAIFAMEYLNDSQYVEQMLFLKDNRLYLLQYSGNSPQLLALETKKDFQYIMESFEVI